MNARPLHGHNLLGKPHAPKAPSILGQRFVVPPFSVLDTKTGWWQRRKRAWLSLGIQSELGRPDKTGAWARIVSITKKPSYGQHYNESAELRSVFDPVLCELAYTWFCPPGGQVIDPFAGGSVRGIVAARLGLSYWGCDLSAAQVKANMAQATAICPDAVVKPNGKTARLRWHVGDADHEIDDHAPRADFLFTCPPYGDLEAYSNDPRDLSRMTESEFDRAYTSILVSALGKLRNNRFACIVVGNYRRKRPDTDIKDLVGATIKACAMGGALFYNDAVLLTAVGTLGVRTSYQFPRFRKLGRQHQNVLVFCKGDHRKAAALLREKGGGEP